MTGAEIELIRVKEALESGHSVPLYKEAWVQREQYAERGVKYVYNDRQKVVYLSVAAAPTFADGVEHPAHMTGYLAVSGGVHKARNIDAMVEDVKRQYLLTWGNNPKMAMYADTLK